MSTPPLPILAISLDAYRILFRNFGIYLRLSWLPFLIFFAASTGMQFYYRDIAGSYDTGNSLVHMLGSLFEGALWLLTIPIATAWTRWVLQDSAVRAPLRLGRAEAVYLLRYAQIAVLAIGAFMLVAVPVVLLAAMTDGFGLDHMNPETGDEWFTITLVGILVPAVAFTLVVVSRFLLALPAAAIGNVSRLRDSFAFTKGRMWALATILILTMLPEEFGSLVSIVWGPDAELGPNDGIFSAAWIAIQYYAASWLFFPVSVGALALAYRHLGGMADSAAPHASTA